MQIDGFGELMPTDRDTSLSREDRILNGGRGGIFEAQAVQTKLPLTNAVHQLNARKSGRRVPETFEAEHHVRSALDVSMPGRVAAAHCCAAAPSKNRTCAFRSIRLKPLQRHLSTPGSTTSFSGMLRISTAIEMVHLEVAS